jgi:hypothetical protein
MGAHSKAGEWATHEAFRLSVRHTARRVDGDRTTD